MGRLSHSRRGLSGRTFALALGVAALFAAATLWPGGSWSEETTQPGQAAKAAAEAAPANPGQVAPETPDKSQVESPASPAQVSVVKEAAQESGAGQSAPGAGQAATKPGQAPSATKSGERESAPESAKESSSQQSQKAATKPAGESQPETTGGQQSAKVIPADSGEGGGSQTTKGELSEGGAQPSTAQPSQGESPKEEAKGSSLHGVINFLLFLVSVALIIGFPVGLAYFICEKWRAREYFGRISFILFTIVAAIAILLTRWPPKLGIDLSGGVILVYEVEGAVRQPGMAQQSGEEQAIDMDQLIAALNRRVNPSGVKEVTIRRFGPQQVEIIIPEVDEEEVARLERVISSIGTLEFRILANMRDHRRVIERALALPPDEQELYDDRGNLVAWWVPVAKGQEEAMGNHGEIAVRMGKHRGEDWLQVLVMKDRYDVTGADLLRVREDVSEDMQPCVSFVLRPGSAQQRFGALTSENRPDPNTDFQRRLGIVLDGYLYSAPMLRQPIFDRGQITGIPSRDEVLALVQVLQAGSLPAVLSPEPISRLVTGPQLGRDTIRQSVIAMAISAVIVFVFIIAYYRFAGMVACLAVVLTLLMLVALMILLKAAFTLPGLAGLTLTVGMAVDANVLIYERMREELQRKATLRMAIRNGFERAMSAIVDSNLTTMLTAVILYFVGTDQVRGFAVTLFLGLVLNLYTAVFISRIVFEIAERRKWIKKLTMLHLIGLTKFDFMGVKWYNIGGSAVVILIGLIAVAARGTGILDIDFTGGVAVEALFKQPKDVAEVRNRLRELPDLAVSDIRLQNEEPHRRFMINTSSPRDVEPEAYLRQVKERIAQIFGDELVHYTVEIEPLTSGESERAGKKLGAIVPSGWWPTTFSSLMLAEAATGAAPDGGQPAPVDTPASGRDAVGSPATPSAAVTTPSQGPRSATPVPSKAVSAGDRFAGGTRVLLRFDHKVSYEALENLLKEQLAKLPEPDRAAAFEIFNKQYRRGDTAGYTEWEVRLALPPEKGMLVIEKLRDELQSVPYFPSSNTIGGKVASSTRIRAVYALVLSVLGMMIYLWVRFTKVAFGVAAAAALVHDVLITVGMLALSAFVANFLGFLLIEDFKIGLSVLAALLTIIGYSANDTIVVFDRIRETKGKSMFLTAEIINNSINQTLSRTLLTGLTTLFVIMVLYIGGGAGIRAFSFTLLVGVITGTYSSIFIASPVLLWLSPKPKTPTRAESLQYVS